MKKSISFTLSAFLLLFYAVVILYSLFAIVQIHTLSNFPIGMLFEIIGLCILAVVILSAVSSRSIKLAYQVSLIIVTLLYTIILDAVNLALIAALDGALFGLLHLGLLFVYCLVSIPMYIVGKR